MKEQLIKFKTAKLAKEKGFKLGIGWHGIDHMFYYEGELTTNHRGNNLCAPTQSLLQKWLYETKLIWVEPIYNDSYKWFQCVIYDLRTNDCLGDIFGEKSKTPFEALEKGLQEGLKLI